MRRALTTAALGGVVLLALPVPAAYACSPSPYQLMVSPDRVAAGATVRVSGEELIRKDGTAVGPCDGWDGSVPTTPPPSETPTATPSPEPSEPSETPLLSLPPLPVAPAHAEAAPATATATPAPVSPLTTVRVVVPPAVVELRIEPTTEWNEPDPPSRFLARVPASTPVQTVHGDDREKVTKHSFAATVRIPRDLAPGTYEILAFEKGGISYGAGWVEVLEELSATGAHTAGLLGVAALALISGAYATVVAGRVGRRAAR